MFLLKSLQNSGKICLLLLITGAISACASADLPTLVEEQTSEIVDGTTTTNWPAVGALVLDDGGSNFASFCTATLIAPNWLLTAAHCLSGDDIPPTWAIKFATCSNATSRAACGTSNLHQAAATYPHPNYAADETHAYDIALVQLESDLAGVTPIPLRNVSPQIGTQITWVGYGLSDGTNQTGSGVKRTGNGEVEDIYSLLYTYSKDGGALPCSGDSGGPSFMYRNSQWEIGGTVTAGDENCLQSGIDTRVDVHIDWINSTMDGEVWEPCSLLGGSCESNQLCAPLEPNNCIPANGERTGTSCNSDMETWTESWPCSDGAICLNTVEDEPATGQCFQYCQTDANCGSGEECTDPIFEDVDYGVCVQQSVDCTWGANDCPAGNGCFPTSDDGFQCYQSDEIAVGNNCDSNMEEWTSLPCADAGICLQVSDDVSDGRCFQACTNDSQCGSGDECVDIFQDLEGVGACLCRDADGDGVCEADDCDDNDDSVSVDCGSCVDSDGDNYGVGCDAGADCDDNDASIHENCGASSCVDNDGDGFGVDCPAGPDCDDNRSDTNSAAGEACGDNIDNNCNGSIDEGCENCTDNDSDGYCDTDDCNDSNASINSAASEICDDNIDNNCNGIIDENCGGSCTDADGDGYCEAADCNDQAGAVHPGAPEMCDNIDNNCDGTVDENCEDRPINSDDDSASGNDSGCSSTSSRTPSWFGLLALGLVLRRRKR